MSLKPEQLNYPIGCEAHWHCADKLAPSHVDDWLLHSGSLTERLKQHCTDFEVLVLGEDVGLANLSEQGMFQFEPVIIREVLLLCDGNPWVFARSLLPEALVNGEKAPLSNLGNKSLGSIIFNDPKMKRAPFEVANFSAGSSVAQLAKNIGQVAEQSLWGRRSLFHDQANKLLVSEVFLPLSPLYQKKND